MQQMAKQGQADGRGATQQTTQKPLPVQASERQLEHLQRTIGNHGVLRRCKSIFQAKLRIGSPRDRYEQEADQVAERVMRMPEPAVQRQSDEEEDLIQAKPMAGQITPLVQRQVEPEEDEEEEPIQTKAVSGRALAVTPEIGVRTDSLRGRGRPLPESTRAFFEPRFGSDLSQVHVHTGDQATEAANALNARAFAIGQDIVFGAGQYKPSGSAGQKLIAHELAHVIQQQPECRHTGTPSVQRQPKGSIPRILDESQIVLALSWYEMNQGTALWRSEWVGPISKKLGGTACESVDAKFVNLIAQFQATLPGKKTVDGTFDPQTRMRLMTKFPDLGNVQGLDVCEVGRPPEVSIEKNPLAQEREGEKIAPIETTSETINYEEPFGGDTVIAGYAAKLAAEYAARTTFKEALKGYQGRERSYKRYYTKEAREKVRDPKLSKAARAERIKEEAELKIEGWRKKHPGPTKETHEAYSRDHYYKLLDFEFEKYTAMTIHRLIWQSVQAGRRSKPHFQLLATHPDEDLKQKIALAQYVINLDPVLSADKAKQAEKLARSGIGKRAIAKAQRDAVRGIAAKVGEEFALLLQGSEAQGTQKVNLGRTWRGIRWFIWQSYGRIMASGDKEAEKREKVLQEEKRLFGKTVRVPQRGAVPGLKEKMEALVYSERVVNSIDEARKKAGENLVAAKLEDIKAQYGQWVTKNRRMFLRLKNAWMVMEREKLGFETRSQGLRYPSFGAPKELSELREIPEGISRNVSLEDVANSLFLRLKKVFKSNEEFVSHLLGMEEEEKASLIEKARPLIRSSQDSKTVREQVKDHVSDSVNKLATSFNTRKEAPKQTVEVPRGIVDQYTNRIMKVRDTMVRVDVVTFAEKLRKVSSIGFTGSSYGGHGGGGVKGMGFSIDLFPKLKVDKRGFYDPDKTAQFFRFIHQAATECGCRWRAVYNDFLVANVINRELKKKYIAFVIWHGPRPYVLHIHLDVVPVEDKA